MIRFLSTLLFTKLSKWKKLNVIVSARAEALQVGTASRLPLGIEIFINPG